MTHLSQGHLPEGGQRQKKKKKQKTWQMNRFMGRRYLTLQIQLHRVKNEHNRLNIHEIKKKKPSRKRSRMRQVRTEPRADSVGESAMSASRIQ